MKKYQVSYTYLVTVEVEAIDEDQALDLASEVEFDFKDAANSGASLSMCDFSDVIVEEV